MKSGNTLKRKEEKKNGQIKDNKRVMKKTLHEFIGRQRNKKYKRGSSQAREESGRKGKNCDCHRRTEQSEEK